MLSGVFVRFAFRNSYCRWMSGRPKAKTPPRKAASFVTSGEPDIRLHIEFGR